MSIYTKTGDKGSTSLFDGQRIKKYALRVDTYGIFDECTAQISVAEKQVEDAQLKQQLNWIQEKLFHLNAEIATAENYQKLKTRSTLIETADIQQLEQWIDCYSEALPPVTSFILPGQSLAGAQLHVARTVCRRGERRLIELSEEEEIRAELKQFVNRLSDCLYTFARVADDLEKVQAIVAEVMKRYVNQKSNEHQQEGFSKVQKVFEACMIQARQLGVPVSMALVDASGLLIASYRMPEALLVSIELAQKKAYSAVAMKQPTADLQAAVQPNASLYQLETLTDGAVVTFGGGVPIYQEQRLIGGLGISGGTVEEDQQVAQAGLEMLREIDYAGK